LLCPKCGTNNREEANYCKNCRADFIVQKVIEGIRQREKALKAAKYGDLSDDDLEQAGKCLERAESFAAAKNYEGAMEWIKQFDSILVKEQGSDSQIEAQEDDVNSRGINQYKQQSSVDTESAEVEDINALDYMRNLQAMGETDNTVAPGLASGNLEQDTEPLLDSVKFFAFIVLLGLVVFVILTIMGFWSK